MFPFFFFFKATLIFKKYSIGTLIGFGQYFKQDYEITGSFTQFRINGQVQTLLYSWTRGVKVPLSSTKLNMISLD